MERMTMRWWVPAMVFGCALVSSCTRYVPLTVELMEKSSLSTDDLKYVQLYLSKDTLLERKLKPAERKDDDAGPIGLHVEQILVDEKTPGIADKVVPEKLKDDRMRITVWVSFEPGLAYPFVVENTGTFNLDSRNRRLIVGDKTFDVEFEGTERPYLMVEEDQGIEIRKLKGRRLDD